MVLKNMKIKTINYVVVLYDLFLCTSFFCHVALYVYFSFFGLQICGFYTILIRGLDISTKWFWWEMLNDSNGDNFYKSLFNLFYFILLKELSLYAFWCFNVFFAYGSMSPWV